MVYYDPLQETKQPTTLTSVHDKYPKNDLTQMYRANIYWYTVIDNNTN